MINIDDFVKRLEAILDYYNLNASSFADKIGVQRSSMSHLLSGRNKPSLDFILKISEVFPEVDLYWILIGKGNFPKNNDEEINTKKNNTSEIGNITPLPSDENLSFKTHDSEKVKSQKKSVFKNFNAEESEIEKILFFYKDGTFKAYSP
ncbi:helix-turn-helix domain-containing protein [Flavobacterium chungangense]|nr:helix-turn-helix transcriptional regulator [Flavobacterium chungangense]